MLKLIEVTATSTNLTTPEAVAAELRSSYDATLPWERWIRVASRRVLNYCDPERLSLLSTWEEQLEGSDGANLLLSRRPITDLTEVLFDGTEVTDAVLDETAGMLYRPSGFPRLHRLGLGAPWVVEPAPTGDAVLGWVITYDAGYIPAGCYSGVTMPDEIEQACLEVLKAQVADLGRNPAVRSETVGALSVTYGTEGLVPGGVEELPATARALLEPWR